MYKTYLYLYICHLYVSTHISLVLRTVPTSCNIPVAFLSSLAKFPVSFFLLVIFFSFTHFGNQNYVQNCLF